MKAWVLALAATFALGCDEDRQGTIEPLAETDQAELLAEHCAEIAAHDDLTTLLRRFDALTDRLLRLTAPPLTEARLEQLRRTQEEHERVSLKLHSLLRSDWTDARWPLRLRWALGENGTPPSWRPGRILSQRALFGGLRWPEGIDTLSLEGGDLKLTRSFSSLEACRMVRGLVLWVEISEEGAPTRAARSYRLTLPRKENTP